MAFPPSEKARRSTRFPEAHPSTLGGQPPQVTERVVPPGQTRPAPAPQPVASFEPGPTAPALVALSAPVPMAPGPLAENTPGYNTAKAAAFALLAKAVPGLSPDTGVFTRELKQHFEVTGIERDNLGITHVRLQQRYEKARIEGKELVVHLAPAGNAKVVDDAISGDPSPAAVAQAAAAPPKLSEEQAIARALRRFAREHRSASTSDLPAPQACRVETLFHRRPNGRYVRALEVQVLEPGASRADQRRYLFGASAGRLLAKWGGSHGFLPDEAVERLRRRGAVPPRGSAEARTSAPEKPGPGNDHSLYSGTVELATRKTGPASFLLLDDSRNGATTERAISAQTSNNPAVTGTTPLHDADDLWGAEGEDKVPVDAQYAAQVTLDFYRDVLGRNSLDGQGEALKSRVHVGKDWVNARWSGNAMDYGDGDGVAAGPLVSLDIAGHEIAHGLTERTAGLEYKNESGALNEAFSDIVSVGVRAYASQTNPAVRTTYRVGEEAITPKLPGDALRYLDDPRKDGVSIDHYSRYRKGMDVHLSSGIANNAFYLLAEGHQNRTATEQRLAAQGVAEGIGLEKALKIFARAVMFYMVPTTDFDGAREATLQAARSLYRGNPAVESKEEKAVAQAWAAVGVAATAGSAAPQAAPRLRLPRVLRGL